MQIACAVYTGRFVYRIGDSIEKSLLNQVSHLARARVYQRKTYVTVDKAELRHQQIYSRHTHKGREHTQNQRAFHQKLASGKLEGRYCKRRKYTSNVPTRLLITATNNVYPNQSG